MKDQGDWLRGSIWFLAIAILLLCIGLHMASARISALEKRVGTGAPTAETAGQGEGR